MAARRSKSKGGGGFWGVILALAIVATLVIWMLSSIGHALGLTPTFSEVTDRPDGWVTDHYEHVLWGYLLTVAAMASVVALIWLAVRAASASDELTAGRARHMLSRVAVTIVVLLVVVITAPVGHRSEEAVTVRAASRLVTVPNVTGLIAMKAAAALDDADLDATFRDEPENERRCRVFAQDPVAGAQVDHGTDVELRCRARVPRVVRRSPSTAEIRIEDAGFRARIVNPPGDGDESRCRVRSQSRSGSAEPESTVALRLRCKPKPPPQPVAGPTPVEPSESDCDPSYTGACLDPGASDYDCLGGSGDGPQYTGTVQVVGDDHFDLDRDGDGVGCQS